MAQEIGESREAWGRDVWELAEDMANGLKSEQKPFWIVYAAKQDRSNPHIFRQTIKSYYQKPPKMFGVLVWYVNHPKGEFKFVPELSAPPDVPLDPSLLSTKSSDFAPSVAAQGETLQAILS